MKYTETILETWTYFTSLRSPLNLSSSIEIHTCTSEYIIWCKHFIWYVRNKIDIFDYFKNIMDWTGMIIWKCDVTISLMTRDSFSRMMSSFVFDWVFFCFCFLVWCRSYNFVYMSPWLPTTARSIIHVTLELYQMKTFLKV